MGAESELAAEQQSINATSTDAPVVVYLSRWLMLVLFSLLSMSNAIMWVSYAPIAETTEQWFNCSELVLNMFSIVYMAVFIPGSFLSSYIVEHYSLRTGIVAGALLNLLGGAMRILPYPFTDGSGTLGVVFAMAGQTIASAAQTFILAMPATLAQNWFGEGERVTATAVASIANQVGVAIGMGLSPTLVPPNHGSRIPLMHVVETAIAVIPAVLIVVLFRSKPPTPPSISACKQDHRAEMGIGAAIVQLASSLPYVLLVLAFGLSTGAFYAIATLYGIQLQAAGYESQIGIFGVSMTLVGIVGGVIWGVLGDWTQQPRVLIAVGLAGGAAGALAYTLLLGPNEFWPLLLSLCAIGFFLTAILPLCLDTSAEITYPMPEVLPSNLLVSSAQVFGITEILVMMVLEPYGFDNWFLSGVLVLTALLSVFIRIDKRRLEDEERGHKAHSAAVVVESDSAAQP